MCKQEVPATLPPLEGKTKRIKNILADHIVPIVNPKFGFEGYDSWIERAFIELDGFQALCYHCHTEHKTKEEKSMATLYNSLRKDYPLQFSAWKGMLQRCNNPQSQAYRHYGGRGITVCKAWEDFTTFFTDMGPRPKGLSIDRIDNDGNYEPGNCRWANKSTQSRNTRVNHVIVYKGVERVLEEWAEILGIKSNTILTRLKRGWPTDEALEFKQRITSLTTSRLPEDTWQEIYALRKQGYTITELSELFEIDTSQISRKTSKALTEEELTLSKIITKRKGDAKNSKLTPEILAEIRSLKQAGHLNVEIARKVGLCAASITRALRL